MPRPSRSPEVLLTGIATLLLLALLVYLLFFHTDVPWY